MVDRTSDIASALETFDLIVDVRSPGEFAQAHIPRAHNIALFTDEERAEVGIAYTKVSQEEAIRLGHSFVDPKKDQFIEQARALGASQKPLLLHCWRGGMRSAAVADLFDGYGIDVTVMEGGYKAYRHHVLSDLEKPWPFVIIGGRTGSAKTDVLQALAHRHAQVIDIEGIANHRGSAFGALGLPPQPSSEMAMNMVHDSLRKFSKNEPIYIEDEGPRVGSVVIHAPMHVYMQSCRTLVLNVPILERARYTAGVYGDASKSDLIDSFRRIRKRFGGERVQRAIDAVERDDLVEASRIALEYYDPTYDYALSKRAEALVRYVECAGLSADEVAQKILKILAG